jgi:exopolyphosphatase/guanosine-5'-triphosphate,3'-diphosphate pyrophosphatase
MPKLAAIDIGTNSVKMTIAECNPGSSLEILDEQMEITRLGKGVDESKKLSDESIEATLKTLEKFHQISVSNDAKLIRACGTSALRDAQNGHEFILKANKILGVNIEIISGEREAKLSFLGAMSELNDASKYNRVLMFDVGGGSTEIIIGNSKGIEYSHSFDIGAVRLKERVLKHIPHSKEEDSEAHKLVENIISPLKDSKLQLDKIDRVIGIGGTATTLLSMTQAQFPHKPSDSEVAFTDIQYLWANIFDLTLEERRKFPGLDPKRADIIDAGMIIIFVILGFLDEKEFTVSSRGVRHGLLLESASNIY